MIRFGKRVRSALVDASAGTVNLKGKNKILNQQRSIQAWDELEREGIIRIIRHADGYQILPSSEHINQHRAIRRPKR